MTTITDDFAAIIADLWGTPNAEADTGLRITEVRAIGEHVVVIAQPTGTETTVAYAQPTPSLESLLAELVSIKGEQPPTDVAHQIEHDHPGIVWITPAHPLSAVLADAR
ncbi:hypothetical protein AA0Z99_00260 [Agrococcus sp. 1P02AA]|uniref:hypothetical protein n=1 Tax=Agrococcus sp. 1P02AA TaxID=3132259 RepID=UPI0039A75654